MLTIVGDDALVLGGRLFLFTLRVDCLNGCGQGVDGGGLTGSQNIT